MKACDLKPLSTKILTLIKGFTKQHFWRCALIWQNSKVKHWAGILAIETHHAKNLIFNLLVQNIFCCLLFLKREIYDCLRMHNLLREVNRLVLTLTDHFFRSSLFFFRNLKSFGKYQFWVDEVGSLSRKETICGTVDDI